MEKIKMLYVSNSCFPNMASGIRINNLSLLFKKIGADVIFYSCNDYDETIPEKNKQSIEFYHSQNFVKFNFNKQIYYFNKNKKNKFQTIKNIIELFVFKKNFKNIKKICSLEQVNTIILYNPSYVSSKKIVKYCKKENISLLIDNTEWYEVNNEKNFFNNYIAKSVNKRITKLDYKINRIISISPWMTKWYLNRNIKSICIMPLMTVFKKPVLLENKETISILYCGVPGTKDLLLPFVDAIIIMNNKRLRLDIVGVNANYFSYDNLENYNIFCHGKLPHNEVYKFYENADFSCLFRNDLRYAKAGFSTKVAESLSYGVPILCNKVGGTDDIIESNYNGIKINNFDSHDINYMLNQLLNLKNDEIYKMKVNAYNTALELFDMANYNDKLKDFLN